MADKHGIKRGQFWRNDKGWQIRVMGVVDNYAMCRRPGASPFCVALREFKNYQQLAVATKDKTP
jgi:hypothetical protein